MSSTLNYWKRGLIAAAALALVGCADRVVAPGTNAPAARFDAVGSKGFDPLPAPAHGDIVVSRVIDQRAARSKPLPPTGVVSATRWSYRAAPWASRPPSP